jgi:hypothetical protein
VWTCLSTDTSEMSPGSTQGQCSHHGHHKWCMDRCPAWHPKEFGSQENWWEFEFVLLMTEFLWVVVLGSLRLLFQVTPHSSSVSPHFLLTGGGTWGKVGGGERSSRLTASTHPWSLWPTSWPLFKGTYHSSVLLLWERWHVGGGNGARRPGAPLQRTWNAGQLSNFVL